MFWNREDRPQDPIVEAITGTNHRVAHAVGSHRKLDRNKWIVLPMKEFQLAAVVVPAGFQILDDAGMDKSRQKIIEHHVLVMKPDELLNLPEFHFVIFFHGAIVKAQEESLEL